MTGEAVYLDFSNALKDQGVKGIREKYGNLFSMYERITGEDPYKTPMRIFPAVHYTMGGLWVDYDLQSTVPGLFVLGEANFSDHGANRLGASALMQGLADGYFIAPYTVGHYLAGLKEKSLNFEDCEKTKNETKDHLTRLLNLKGSQSVDQIHRKLGRILWNHSGMIRSENSLKKALEQIRSLKQEFWNEAVVTGQNNYKNQELEKAGRVADFLELGEILIQDALIREESCGCHFREEYQTQDNEALRNDENFSHVTAWEWSEEKKWWEWREPLSFLKVKPSQRSYK